VCVPPSLRLSKSRYVAGLQCHKLLWWKVHDRDAPELVPDPVARNRFEQGDEVTRAARGRFPGGRLIDLPPFQYDNKIAATREALAGSAPAIFEATFEADDTIAAVDVLERAPGGWAVIEVKSSTKVKPEHLPDLAIQVHILRRCGLPVTRAEVMHLNSACRFPDLGNLFTRVDVTREVEAVLLGVPDEVASQRRMLRGLLPDVAIGEHCTKPYACPFLERCWPVVPDDHVSSLYRVGRVKALSYEADGYSSIRDLPSDFEMNVIHQRQVRAVMSGRMVVEPALARALEQFVSPIAYLDFETVAYAVPRWTGCRPWQNVPVQFSVHIEQGRRLAHHAWIAEGPDDPRPALARALVQACAGARCVVAYYASFERDCLEQMAEAVPQLSAELLDIAARLVDLLPVVRNHVYHPDFGGGFSIKQVLPALVPALAYRDLAFQDGMLASLELMRLMQQQERIPLAARTRLRDDLLAYCERDTLAMVKLLERLRGMVGAQLELF
jgi:hypothetical protein